MCTKSQASHAGRPREPEAADHRDRGGAADGGHAALVAVTEGPGRAGRRGAASTFAATAAPAGWPPGRRRAAGARRARGRWHRSPIDEHLGVTGHREIGLDQHPAGAIERHAERARERRGGHPRRPQHGARADLLAARARPRRASRCVTARAGAHLHAEAREARRRAWADSGSGKLASMPRPGLERGRSRAWVGSMSAEVARDGLARDLGERARQLDAGGPAADDDEGEQRPRSAPSRSRSAASKASSTRRRISSASSRRLEAGRQLLPVVVAEVGVAGARGEHERVVGQLALVQDHAPAGQVHRLGPRPASRVTLAARLRIERSGVAMSATESAAVATW